MQLNKNYRHRIKISFIKKEHARTLNSKKLNISHILYYQYKICDMFKKILFRKEAFHLNISSKKDTTKDKKIKISSLKQGFKNLRHSF